MCTDLRTLGGLEKMDGRPGCLPASLPRLACPRCVPVGALPVCLRLLAPAACAACGAALGLSWPACLLALPCPALPPPWGRVPDPALVFRGGTPCSRVHLYCPLWRQDGWAAPALAPAGRTGVGTKVPLLPALCRLTC